MFIWACFSSFSPKIKRQKEEIKETTNSTCFGYSHFCARFLLELSVALKNSLLWALQHFKDVAYFRYCAYFCASRGTQVSYGWCLLQGYFCAVSNCAEKAELSRCSWYPKLKFGVTMHFSEIIKLQFGKKTSYIALCFSVFFFLKNNCCLIISTKYMVTPNFLFGFQ